MKKKIFALTLLVILLALNVSAQTATQEMKKDSLIVYQVSGQVLNITNPKMHSAVERKQILSLTDKINLTDNSYVKLLDIQNHKLYTLKDKCSGRIDILLSTQSDNSKNLTKQYFAFILKSLIRKDTDAMYNSGLTTATFRNDNDSLLSKKNPQPQVKDSVDTK